MMDVLVSAYNSRENWTQAQLSPWASLNSCVLVKPEGHCITSADNSSPWMEVPYVHPQFLPCHPSLFAGPVWRSIERTGFAVKELKFKSLICNLPVQWPKTNRLLSLGFSLRREGEWFPVSRASVRVRLKASSGRVSGCGIFFLMRFYQECVSKLCWPGECPRPQSLWARTRGHCSKSFEHP